MKFRIAGANYESAARAADCQQTASVGIAHHIHRAHQESVVQVLGSRLRPLRARNRKVSQHVTNGAEFNSDFDF